MKMSIILSKAKGIIKSVAYHVNKHSPEILMISGIGLGITAGIVACKQTRKADDIIDDAHAEILELENIEAVDDETANSKEISRVVNRVKAGMALNVCRVYAPAFILASASIACIVCSNQIMKKRIAVLASAYATLDASFRDYRQRVVDQYGEDVDKDLYFGVTKEELPNKSDDGEESTETVEKVKITPNDTTVIFGPENPYFNVDPTYNRALINSTMAYMNQELNYTDHMYLNEGFRRLGFEETKIGQVIGWGPGDTIILGMRELDNPDHEIAIEFKGCHYIFDNLK